MTCAPVRRRPSPEPSPDNATVNKTLCIEGWRGVSHSIALVNQHQLLAMLRTPGLRLRHRDLPFFLPHWNAKTMPAGFSAEEQAQIDAIPAPAEGERIDTVLRISSPFRSHIAPGQKTLTFMVTECGLLPECFDTPDPVLADFTRGANRIVTPSRWSRDRLVDYGLDAAGILVVPHGVKADTFRPLTPVERAVTRQALGIGPDEVLFVNIGVATWNKGLDLLVTAFARVRQRHANARLLIKDHQSLYGIGADRILAQVGRQYPGLIDDRVLAGISLVSGSLDQAQIRALYGVADAYVSPYRAEGFNLPVLEAMACGAPVLVTEGGATDDFCPPALATRLPARPGTAADEPTANGRFLVPDVDALTEHLAHLAAAGPRGDPAPAAETARRQLVDRFGWDSVTQELLALV